MVKRGFYNLALRAVVFAVVFSLTAGPILNAADPDSSARTPHTLAENLFQYATDLSRTLHERSSDDRSLSDYRRALDAYGQVARLNTDTHFSAESLMKMSELQREMADAANDSVLYQQAIATFRRIIIEHPQSSFVGDALMSIAQVYEENLQDLEGAAAAYRELIAHFPSSVMAREARAVLARFEAQLSHRPVDVLISPQPSSNTAPLDESQPRLTNVRNFTGPDYARVVIDLSDEAQYSGGRGAGNRLSIQLRNTAVSPALYGRRFIVGEFGLLKRIMVRGSGASSPLTEIQIDVGSLADYSMFRLSGPERIIVDIHTATAGGRVDIDRQDSSQATEEVEGTKRSAVAGGGVRSGSTPGQAILSLPEITDPILPSDPTKPKDSRAAVTDSLGGASITVESKGGGDSPVKLVVIDPGHGGHDTGTVSGNGLREKDLVLDVARRLKAYIKGKYPGIEVIMTRESDRFVALEERTAIANSRHADLFISVHANASPSSVASGVETFFVSPDRAGGDQEPGKTVAELTKPAVQSKQVGDSANPEPIVASVRVGNRVAESRELARYIQAGLVRGIGAASPKTAANRGVKHASFAVLVGASMPSVLAEVSFISNPRDEALLQTTQFRERIAASLFAGLNGYLKRNRPHEAKAK